MDTDRERDVNSEGMYSTENNQYISDECQIQQQMGDLYEEIKNYYNYTDKNRKKYKHYIQGVNVIVSVLYPLTALSISLSFLENLQVWLRILSLLFSTIGTITPLAAKGLAWNGKLQQRTITYLKLDELMRDIRYEKVFDEQSLNKYVEHFKNIVSADNQMGLDNVVVMKQHAENVLKDTGK